MHVPIKGASYKLISKKATLVMNTELKTEHKMENTTETQTHENSENKIFVLLQRVG